MSMGRFWDIMMGCMMPRMMQTAEDGPMGLIKGMMDPDAKSGALYGPKNSGTKGKAVWIKGIRKQSKGN
jgi:hypothetical protein